MCITDGILRARLDGELAAGQAEAVNAHLAECESCRRRAEQISARAARTGELLSALAPDESPADARTALARWRASQPDPRASWVSRLFPRRFAPAWGGAAAALLIVLLAASGQTRAFAQKLLGLFRVRNIAVVTIDRSTLNDSQGKLFGKVLADQLQVTKEGKPQVAASREEASRLAGFAVRLPSARRDRPQIVVEGEHGFQLVADLARLDALLGILGRTDLRFPDSVQGAKVMVDIPRGVVARYGTCPAQNVPPESWYDCVSFGQFPSPTVVTEPELNLAPIAEIGLQVAGMSAAEARAFSQSVDWTSTLVLPVPRNVASYENVQVDGARAALITQNPIGNRPAGYNLLWTKNGVIYSLAGFGNPAAALPLAESIE